MVYHIDRLTRRPIELEQFVAGRRRRQGPARPVRDRRHRPQHRRRAAGRADAGGGRGQRVRDEEPPGASARWSRTPPQGKPHKRLDAPVRLRADHVTVRADEAEVYPPAGRPVPGRGVHPVDRDLAQRPGGPDRDRAGPGCTPTLKGMLRQPARTPDSASTGAQVVGAGSVGADHHRGRPPPGAGQVSPSRRPADAAPRSATCSPGCCAAASAATRLYSARPQRDHPPLRVPAGPDHGGCGRLTVVADPVERLVADAVLYRLDTPELADALHGRSSADARTQELDAGLWTEASEQLEELAARLRATARSPCRSG